MKNKFLSSFRTADHGGQKNRNGKRLRLFFTWFSTSASARIKPWFYYVEIGCFALTPTTHCIGRVKKVWILSTLATRAALGPPHSFIVTRFTLPPLEDGDSQGNAMRKTVGGIRKSRAKQAVA